MIRGSLDIKGPLYPVDDVPLGSFIQKRLGKVSYLLISRESFHDLLRFPKRCWPGLDGELHSRSEKPGIVPVNLKQIRVLNRRHALPGRYTQPAVAMSSGYCSFFLPEDLVRVVSLEEALGLGPRCYPSLWDHILNHD